MVTQGLYSFLFYNDFSQLHYIKTSGFSGLTFYSLTGQQCVLYYIKSTPLKGQRVRTQSYKLEYPVFPDQPTSDQFFDEAQFAAYRDLGYNIAQTMEDKLNILDEIDRRDGRKRRLAAVE